MAALRDKPVIADLTEPLVGLDDEDWNLTISSLTDCGLATVQSDESEIRNSQSAIDAHPLIREYFAKQLREKKPESWRGAHRRLYEYLRDTTKEGDRPTLEDLQPLYQAVAHGCQAGLHEDARAKVYRDRIQRGIEAYSTKKLGALGSDLGAIACFFETPWSRFSPAITEAAQAWLLNEAAFSLRALGRLTEALDPFRAGLALRIKQELWVNAARFASNLSELELTLGKVAGAVGDAEQSVTYADRSGDADMRMIMRTTHADALYQAGRLAEADARFHDAEKMQGDREPDCPLLYSMQGFQYCDLLLTDAERAAWQTILQLETRNSKLETAAASCRATSERAAKAIKIAERNNWLLDIALDHLTMGRVALYASILESGSGAAPLDRDGNQWRDTGGTLDAAATGLRRAGSQDHIPRGLLTRAWLRSFMGKHTGPESAQTDLDEAWEIAERGPMRLFMADIHLYRARLFHAVKPYPWKSPQEDLAAAEKLINECGYHRRDEELADAKQAILGSKQST